MKTPWDRDRKTKAWERYERGRAYNNRLTPNQYNLVNTNIEFFAGNQWLHLAQTPAMQKLPKPTFNIIKRVASLFVASLTSSAASVSFDELSYYSGDPIGAAKNGAPTEAQRSGFGGERRNAGMGEFSTAGGSERYEGRSDDVNGAAIATAEVQNLLEKFKMDYRIREALFDGAQTGDYCAHFWWDAEAIPYGGAFGPYRGEIQMELVDGINVMFGNPNTPDTERQPYILIIGRDTVEHLRDEMKRHHEARSRREQAGWTGARASGGSGSGPQTSPSRREAGRREQAERDKDWEDGFEDSELQPDSDYTDQAGVGGRTELEADAQDGKALYVIMYEKRTHEEDDVDPDTGEARTENVLDKNGDPVQVTSEDGRPLIGVDGQPVYKTRKARKRVTSVHVTKATKSCVIYEDVDTGLSRYPVAWGNWEKQKNQYHGRALVTGIIPNQIFINSMFAMVMRHLQLMGFPKTVYNADLISHWTNEVGQAIGVRGLQPGQNISQVAYNLQPADMSNQIIQAIDKAVTYTKDCLGATDAQMGNVKPDNTSALMVLQSSAEVPLENTRAGMYEWLEDIGAILLDMMGTYYGQRPMVRDRDFDEIVTDPSTGAPMLNPMTGTMMTNKVTRRVVVEYDFTRFKHLWFNVRVNAGATTYYSEIAMVQTLDNLRRDGTLEIIDYLERIPDKLIPRKAELVRELRQRAAMQAGSPASGGGIAPGSLMAGGGGAKSSSPVSMGSGGNSNPTVGGPLSEDKAVANLPASMQAKYDTMPSSAQRSLRQIGSMGG